jgi:hypothetical protein
MSKISISISVINKDTEESEYVLITDSVAVPRVGDGFLFPESGAGLGVFTVSNVVWCFNSPDGALAAEVTLAEPISPEAIIAIRDLTGIR